MEPAGSADVAAGAAADAAAGATEGAGPAKPEFGKASKLTEGNLRLALVAKLCLSVFFKKEVAGSETVSTVNIGAFLDTFVKHADPSFAGGGKKSTTPICNRAATSTATGKGKGKIQVGAASARSIQLAMLAVDADTDLNSKVADDCIASGGNTDLSNFKIHSSRQHWPRPGQGTAPNHTKVWNLNGAVLRTAKEVEKLAKETTFTLPVEDTSKCVIWAGQKELTLAHVLTDAAGQTGTTITALYKALRGNNAIIAAKKITSRPSSPSHHYSTGTSFSPLSTPPPFFADGHALDLSLVPDKAGRLLLRSLYNMMVAKEQVNVLGPQNGQVHAKKLLLAGGLCFESEGEVDTYMRKVNICRQALHRDYKWVSPAATAAALAEKGGSGRKRGRDSSGKGSASKKNKTDA